MNRELNMRSWQFAAILCFVFATFIMASSGAQAQGGFNVLTRNYNNQRTGADLSETILNASNVNSSQFGKLFMLSVDDQVYAGILYVSDLSIAGGTHNVVYVATVNNSVYAFDADQLGPPLWYRNFNGIGRPSRNSELGQACGAYRDFIGNIGIVGTPVIDGSTRTMYFVTRTVENGATVQRLRAIDITTGNDQANSPQVIQATVPGTGEGSKNSLLVFNPVKQNQRPALSLSQGLIYIAWASFCDTSPYHGWMMAYDAASLTQVGVFNATPNGRQGGIWMAGAAPAFDANGNVYFGTGNGSFDGRSEFGESLLKLSPGSLSRLDFFTPSNFNTLNNFDLDFGSQGPTMLPGTHFLVTGGKEGKMYLLDTGNLGQEVTGDRQIPQEFQAVNPTIVPFASHSLRNASPVWNSPEGLNVYVWGENDFLHAFRFNSSTQKFDLPPVATGSILPPVGMPGGMMVVSANESQAGSGMVWATLPRNGDANQQTVPGDLYAFDAETLALVWSSIGAGDDPLNFAKGSPPVVANGKVYIASLSRFVSVYGLKTTPPALQDIALNRPATGTKPCFPNQTPDKAFNGSAQAGPSDKWCSELANAFLQVDLGANFSVNRFVLEHAGAGGEDFSRNTRDFNIQVSMDGINFDTVVSVVGNVQSITTHDISPVTARFVRFNAITPSLFPPFRANIYEFQVFGSPAPSIPDFQVSSTPGSETLIAGGGASYTTTVTSSNGFAGSVSLRVSGLPLGATASFSPSAVHGSGNSTLSISTSGSVEPGSFPLTVTATSGTLLHTTLLILNVNRSSTGSVAVNAASFYNVPAITADGVPFNTGGIFGFNAAYSANVLGSTQTATGIPFQLGPPNVLDTFNAVTIPLPAGQFSTLGVLATTIFGPALGTKFTVTYTDGTSDTRVQGLSDFLTPQNFPGETEVVASYLNLSNGTSFPLPLYLYAYFLAINPAKSVSSVSVSDSRVIVFALTLLPSTTSSNSALSSSPTSLSVAPTATVASTLASPNGPNVAEPFGGDLLQAISAPLYPQQRMDSSAFELWAESAARFGHN